MEISLLLKSISDWPVHIIYSIYLQTKKLPCLPVMNLCDILQNTQSKKLMANKDESAVINCQNWMGILNLM